MYFFMIFEHDPKTLANKLETLQEKTIQALEDCAHGMGEIKLVETLEDEIEDHLKKCMGISHKGSLIEELDKFVGHLSDILDSLNYQTQELCKEYKDINYRHKALKSYYKAMDSLSDKKNG